MNQYDFPRKYSVPDTYKSTKGKKKKGYIPPFSLPIIDHEFAWHFEPVPDPWSFLGTRCSHTGVLGRITSAYYSVRRNIGTLGCITLSIIV
jgi:hypothetical protein